MYSIESMLTGARNPELLGRELNRLVYTRGKRYNSNPSGISIFEMDWDNLVLLDACRFDYYLQESNFDENIDSIQSLGSATYEFIPANFSERQLHDVVLVTTNPQYIKHRDMIDIHNIIYVPDLDLQPSDITDKDVVSPDAVTRIAKNTARKYPNKRLLIHYLQPHRPYIGPTGLNQFDSDTSWRDVSDKLIEKAYRENLQIVLESVRDLLPELTGKSIISSDHGEMLGERYRYIPMKDYGHWDGIYDKRLVEVPWHVFNSKERKEINPESPEREVADEDVTERLELLGYAQS